LFKIHFNLNAVNLVVTLQKQPNKNPNLDKTIIFIKKSYMSKKKEEKRFHQKRNVKCTGGKKGEFLL